MYFLNLLVRIVVVLRGTVLDISHRGHLCTLRSLRYRWIRCDLMCWKNTCNSSGLWGHWGLRPAVLLKSQRNCSSGSATCSSSNKITSLYLLLSRYLSFCFSLSLICQATTAASANCHGNRSRCLGVFPVWWDVNYWPLPLKKRETTVMDMDLWDVPTLPLTQLGTPYATVCIFYDAGLLTCRGWTI